MKSQKKIETKKIYDLFSDLLFLVIDCFSDAKQFDEKGTLEAGKRARKELQKIRNTSKEIRYEIQEINKIRRDKK